MMIRELWREILLFLPTPCSSRVCKMFRDIEREILNIRISYLYERSEEAIAKGHVEAFEVMLKKELPSLYESSKYSEEATLYFHLQSCAKIAALNNQKESIIYLIDRACSLNNRCETIDWHIGVFSEFYNNASPDMIKYVVRKVYRRYPDIADKAMFGRRKDVVLPLGLTLLITLRKIFFSCFGYERSYVHLLIRTA